MTAITSAISEVMTLIQDQEGAADLLSVPVVVVGVLVFL